jgi:hypothetical protein
MSFWRARQAPQGGWGRRPTDGSGRVYVAIWGVIRVHSGLQLVLGLVVMFARRVQPTPVT